MPQHFAIVLDNQIRSWPQIEYQKYPDGIDPTNGGAEITGMANLTEAKRMLLVLDHGELLGVGEREAIAAAAPEAIAA